MQRVLVCVCMRIDDVRSRNRGRAVFTASYTPACSDSDSDSLSSSSSLLPSTLRPRRHPSLFYTPFSPLSLLSLSFRFRLRPFLSSSRHPSHLFPLQVTTRSLRRLLWLPILLPPSPRLLSPLPRSIDGHRHLLLDSRRRTNTEEVRPLSLRPSLSPAHSIHSISPRPAKRLPSSEAHAPALSAGRQRYVPSISLHAPRPPPTKM